jgi:hypothetical protein
MTTKQNRDARAAAIQAIRRLRAFDAAGKPAPAAVERAAERAVDRWLAVSLRPAFVRVLAGGRRADRKEAA